MIQYTHKISIFIQHSKPAVCCRRARARPAPPPSPSPARADCGPVGGSEGRALSSSVVAPSFSSTSARSASSATPSTTNISDREMQHERHYWD